MLTRLLVLLVISLPLLVGASLAAAQGSPITGVPLAAPTVDGVQAQLERLETDTTLEDSAKEAARAALQEALADLRRASELAKETARLRALESEAPAKLESIRAELAAPPTTPKVWDENTSLAQLEQELAQAIASLEASRKLVADLQAESLLRSERRGVIPDRIAALREQLAAMQPPVRVEAEAPAVWEARLTRYQARKLALESEIEALRAELSSYDARQQLLPARRDLAQRKVVEGERLVEALQDAVARQRQAEAERAAREAQRLKREAARQHPVLQQYAAETERRATARLGAGSDPNGIDAAARRVSRIRALRADLDSRFTSVVQRLRASGLGRATGLQLRRLYEMMPDPLEVRRDLRSTRRALDDAEFELIELQEERSAQLSDVERVARELVSQAGVRQDDPSRAEFEAVARELVGARRDLLDQLIADQVRYRDQLRALEAELGELLKTAQQRRAFIEERILWVRSIDRDQAIDLGVLRSSLAWLAEPAGWRDVLTSTKAFVRGSLPQTLLGAMIAVLLWVLGVRGRRVLRRLGGRVARFRTDRFAYTLAAIGLTALIAAPAPFVLYALGWLLGRPQDQTELGLALGSAMRLGAIRLFPALFLYHAVRAQGLAEAHFRWPVSRTRPLRRALRWLVPISITSTIVTLTIDHAAPEPVNASIGRLALSVGLVALAFFLQRTLRSGVAQSSPLAESVTPSVVHRFRRVWRPLLIAFPVVVVLLSWLGFHYTAIRLEARYIETLLLILALIFADALLLRWLFIVRRRVAVEEARRRRAQAMAAPDASPHADKPAAPAPPAIDEDRIDLPAISAQTRQLFRAGVVVSFVLGLAIIWSEALPALRMLDRVQLWPDAKVTSAELTPALAQDPVPQGPGANAGEPAQTQDQPSITLPTQPAIDAGDGAPPGAPVTITLADVGLALVTLIATWLAFKNVPGLVEIILLQRLPLDAGARFALSTVLRYFIAIVGIFIAFNTLGITWGRVQWLAAAFTFGLAFGLQEVFANFVSGLIILAERPVRIGDTVTVGGVTGTVTRIRMRATTITDWDRKELVIPNKTFITSDVINWTLSDPILRVRVPVGVSYGSDVKLVERVLYRLAAESDRVLKDPEPQVVFKNFGDSTLDFELRVYVPDIEHLIPVQHELRNAITEAFREADIEIAFPQRDIHIRSVTEPFSLANPPGPGTSSRDEPGPGRPAPER